MHAEVLHDEDLQALCLEHLVERVERAAAAQVGERLVGAEQRLTLRDGTG